MESTVEVIEQMTRIAKQLEPFKMELKYSTSEHRQAVRDFAQGTHSDVCEACKIFYKCDAYEGACSILS